MKLYTFAVLENLPRVGLRDHFCRRPPSRDLKSASSAGRCWWNMCPTSRQEIRGSLHWEGTSWRLVVSRNEGTCTPKWLVIRQNPIEMDDLGGTPISGNLHILTTKFLEDMLETSWICHNWAQIPWKETYTLSGWWFGCHFLFSHLLGC